VVYPKTRNFIKIVADEVVLAEPVAEEEIQPKNVAYDYEVVNLESI
jgi:hypothetical protein